MKVKICVAKFKCDVAKNVIAIIHHRLAAPVLASQWKGKRGWCTLRAGETPPDENQKRLPVKVTVY